MEGGDLSDSLFWTSNPNHSLLLINDLKCAVLLGSGLDSPLRRHKGQVYIDDVSTKSIAWTKLFRRFVIAVRVGVPLCQSRC